MADSHKLSLHSGSGTLRGGGVRRVYGNMANLKQYKQKIDYRLPLVTVVCMASMAAILFIYGLYQLKGHDTLVEYVKETRDIVQFVTHSRGRREAEMGGDYSPNPDADPTNRDSSEAVRDDMNDEEHSQDVETLAPTGFPSPAPMNTTEFPAPPVLDTTSSDTTTTSTTTTTTAPLPLIPETTTTPNPHWLTLPELDEMSDDFISTYITIWNLFALNLIALLFLVPATILFHVDLLGINKYKVIFRIIVGLVMLFLFIQLLYLISPVLTSTFRFPGFIDRLFNAQTQPKHERGVAQIEQQFACNFDSHPELVQRGIQFAGTRRFYKIAFQDPCLPKIKDSLFPAYATVLLIVLDVLPFVFAAFTYAWDAWLKDCAAVREARMRVELNNQRRPQTREQILQRAIYDQQLARSNDFV